MPSPGSHGPALHTRSPAPPPPSEGTSRPDKLRHGRAAESRADAEGTCRLVVSLSHRPCTSETQKGNTRRSRGETRARRPRIRRDCLRTLAACFRKDSPPTGGVRGPTPPTPTWSPRSALATSKGRRRGQTGRPRFSGIGPVCPSPLTPGLKSSFWEKIYPMSQKAQEMRECRCARTPPAHAGPRRPSGTRLRARACPPQCAVRARGRAEWQGSLRPGNPGVIGPRRPLLPSERDLLNAA